MKEFEKRNSYWLHFVAQSAGVVAILYFGVPIYQQLTDQIGAPPDRTSLLWGLAAALVIQIAYWTNKAQLPPRLPFANLILGAIMQFMARLNFIYASAMFSIVIFVRSNKAELVFWHVALLLIVMFSIFCYSDELERLGRAIAAASTDSREVRATNCCGGTMPQPLRSVVPQSRLAASAESAASIAIRHDPQQELLRGRDE